MKLVGGEFREAISEKTQKNNSRLILALDVPDKINKDRGLGKQCLDIIGKASDSIAAVKVGYPLVLRTGLEIVEKINKGNYAIVIADFKIADIPHVSRQIAERAFEAGAEAVIAHGFTGPDSLEAINQTAEEMGDRGVFVVSNMSHPGGKEFIRPATDRILELVKEVNATGVIGPATRPEEVKDMRNKLGEDFLILTPGIGAQGAKAGDAIRNGADYEIVGRAIYNSDAPGESAERIRNEINETTEGREG